MTHHPKERYGGLNRRDFLLRSAVAASAFRERADCSPRAARRRPGAAGDDRRRLDRRVEAELLGPAAFRSRARTSGSLPLGGPDRVRARAETGGTLTVYNYPDYFYKKLLNEFGKEYGVGFSTPFDNISSGIQRLASGAVSPTSWR